MQNGINSNYQGMTDPAQSGLYVLTLDGISRVNTQGLVNYLSKEHNLPAENIKVLMESNKVFKVEKLSLIRTAGEYIGTPEKTDSIVKVSHQTPYKESWVVSPKIIRNLYR